MKIALDFDSVLSDTMISWTEKYNEKHGTGYLKKDIRIWEFWKDFSITRAYAHEYFIKSWEDWVNLPSTEKDLDQKVSQLSEHGTVDIVTNVDETHLKYVRQWLSEKKIIVNDVIHGGTEKISKPYDLFIDDSPSLAENAVKFNKTCFVYDQQWNREILESGKIIRIHDLTEALNKISNNL